MLRILSLFLSITSFIIIATCRAEEIQLECEVVEEYNNTHISRILNVCEVKTFEITENDTTLLFDHATDNNFTGVILENSKIIIFPKEILELFPQAVALKVRSDMRDIVDHSFRNATQLLDLDFAYNELIEITEFTFVGAENLISLNLNSNQITTVLPKAFDSMPKLERLVLSSNKITTLDKEIFSLLKNLKYFHVSHNELAHIDPLLFIHNEKLSYLNLGRNEFDEAELELSSKRMKKLNLYGTPTELKKLTLRKALGSSDITVIDELQLESCKFTSMSDLMIDEMIHVKSIDMTRNKLTSLVEAPTYLTPATHLKFQLNSIEDISDSFLKQLANLESLELQNNKVKMSPNMFEHLKHLKELILWNNDLRKLEPEWFTGLTKLEKLDVVSNNVTIFDYVSLMNTLPSLKTFSINGNDFKCDYLKKMVEDLKVINRLNVIKDHDLPEEDERGNYFYGIRCDKHLKDRNGFSHSYLKGDYLF